MYREKPRFICSRKEGYVMSIEDADSNGACYASVAEIKRLVKDFESCTLPAQEFNHRAHLAVAAWYLAHHTTEEATRLIRRGLQNFLAANSIVTTDTDGYHETLTLFYITIINRHLNTRKDEISLAELINDLIRRCGDKNLPLKHYTEERLMSPSARRQWVEPDLKSID
jgi:hypothetical protein